MARVVTLLYESHLNQHTLPHNQHTMASAPKLSKTHRVRASPINAESISTPKRAVQPNFRAAHTKTSSRESFLHSLFNKPCYRVTKNKACRARCSLFGATLILRASQKVTRVMSPRAKTYTKLSEGSRPTLTARIWSYLFVMNAVT